MAANKVTAAHTLGSSRQGSTWSRQDGNSAARFLCTVSPSNPTCAESRVGFRQINSLAEKSSLHFWSSSWRSGAGGDRRSLVFGEANALWQDYAEAVEESGLCGIGLGDATQTDLAMGGGWQHDIIRLNARELFEHGSWGIAETSAA